MGRFDAVPSVAPSEDQAVHRVAEFAEDRLLFGFDGTDRTSRISATTLRSMSSRSAARSPSATRFAGGPSAPTSSRSSTSVKTAASSSTSAHRRSGFHSSNDAAARRHLDVVFRTYGSRSASPLDRDPLAAAPWTAPASSRSSASTPSYVADQAGTRRPSGSKG